MQYSTVLYRLSLVYITYDDYDFQIPSPSTSLISLTSIDHSALHLVPPLRQSCDRRTKFSVLYVDTFCKAVKALPV